MTNRKLEETNFPTMTALVEEVRESGRANYSVRTCLLKSEMRDETEDRSDLQYVKRSKSFRMMMVVVHIVGMVGSIVGSCCGSLPQKHGSVITDSIISGRSICDLSVYEMAMVDFFFLNYIVKLE